MTVQRPMNGFSLLDRILALECRYAQIESMLNSRSGLVQLRLNGTILQYREYGEVMWHDLMPVTGDDTIADIQERLTALENSAFQ